MSHIYKFRHRRELSSYHTILLLPFLCYFYYSFGFLWYSFRSYINYRLCIVKNFYEQIVSVANDQLQSFCFIDRWAIKRISYACSYLWPYFVTTLMLQLTLAIRTNCTLSWLRSYSVFNGGIKFTLTFSIH